MYQVIKSFISNRFGIRAIVIRIFVSFDQYTDIA